MSRLAKLELVGPVVLALVIIAAELATCMLAWRPFSAFAWYLNLELFGIFQHSHFTLSQYAAVPYLQVWFIALPILMLAAAGVACRSRLPVALASNLSFT